MTSNVFKIYYLRNLDSFIIFQLEYFQNKLFSSSYVCDADGNTKLHAPAVSFTFTFINMSSLSFLVVIYLSTVREALFLCLKHH